MHTPAAYRNRDVILATLQLLTLPLASIAPHALEIASGSGVHLLTNGPAFPELIWYPTDLVLRSDLSEAASQLPNSREPRTLDACNPVHWSALELDAPPSVALVLCVNMAHISPWEATLGVLAGARRVLAPGGVLVFYGPWWEEDVAVAESNVAFDKSLQARNPVWGIRRLPELVAAVEEAGLVFESRVSMPANNILVAVRQLGK
jgi:SAM-dependent methyltransferase